MATNEFYYNNGKEITSEEAHALRDKSQLVVSDKTLTAEQLKKIKDSR